MGFVRHLPHQLVDAFKSTLEEVTDADLIVHVVDGSHPDPFEQIRAVRQVISEIGAGEVPEIIAINKADVAEPEVIMALLRQEANAFAFSAKTGFGVDNLLRAIENSLPHPNIEIDTVIPYTRGDLVNAIHEKGEVLEEEYRPEGTYLRALVDDRLAKKISGITDTE